MIKKLVSARSVDSSRRAATSSGVAMRALSKKLEGVLPQPLVLRQATSQARLNRRTMKMSTTAPMVATMMLPSSPPAATPT